MTKRRNTLLGIATVLQAVYNRLKEKSNKNRMVKELSTSKNKFSKQKVMKFLNNNIDEAQRILNNTTDQTTEQAANTIISNINQYNNLFDVPFQSGIPPPSPSVQPTPSATPSLRGLSQEERQKIERERMPMGDPTRRERRPERKETQAEAISRGQEQFESPNPQINASNILPPSTQAQEQIEQEQRIPLSRMTPDQLLSEYSDQLARSVRLGAPPQSAEVERERTNINMVMRRLSERYEQITNQVLNQQSLVDAFDEENRNVSNPDEAISSGANTSNIEINQGQAAAPEAAAGGDPIEDAQQEAVSGGSEQVQQTENINRPLNFNRFNETIRQSSQLNQQSINQLVNQAPQSIRPQVRQILNGNVSGQNILRGVIGLGMLYAGVSPAAQTVINSVLDIAQNSGVNVNKYFNRVSASGAVEARVSAIREIPEAEQSYIESYNSALDLSLDLLQDADPIFGTINRNNIYLTSEILRQQITDNIDDEDVIATLDIRTNNFLDVLSGSAISFGEPDFTADEILGDINDEINARREIKKETKQERKEEQKRKPKQGIDVEAEVPATSGAGIGVGIAAGIGAAAGAATSGLGAGIGASIGAAAGVGLGVAGLAGGAVLGGGIGEAAERLLRKPITLPPDTLKVVQQDSKGTGKLRPKFIIPGVNIFQPTEQQIQADINEWNMFDFVNPTSEGANGTAATNPLKLQGLQENEIRYRDAGVDVHPMFNDDLPFSNEQLTEYFIGEPLPALPEMKFQENEQEFFDDRGMPQLSLWGRNGGYNASSQANAIEIISPFRNFTEVTQLDEDINNSILYGQIPMLFNKF